MSSPLGVGTAIYLTEYTREGWATRVIRFGSECLAGVPSIILGVFGFVLFVLKLGLGWSVLSGALTLAIMVLPIIIRTSEEATMALHFYILAREGISMPNAYGSAAVLVISILLINLIAYTLMQRLMRRYS